MKIPTVSRFEIDHAACGKMMKRIRLKAGKSLRYVAGKIGVSASTLMRMENGVMKWTEMKARHVAAITAITAKATQPTRAKK